MSNLGIFVFFWLCFRYEIEYDENRLQIGRDIGKRFLGIPYRDGHSALGRRSVIGAGDEDVGDETDSGIEANKELVTENGDVLLDVELDELVLDVLNDDLIARVEEKLTRMCIFFLNIFNRYILSFVCICICRWKQRTV